MAADTPRPNSAPIARPLTKVVVYYVVLIVAGLRLWDFLPRAGGFAQSFDLLSGTAISTTSGKVPRVAVGESNLSLTVALAMISAILLSIPIEVFRNVTREQLEGVAARAWRRALDQPNVTQNGDGEPKTRIRVRTNDIAAMRQNLEPRLDGQVKAWRLIALAPKPDGSEVAKYAEQIKKKTTPEDLLTLVRTAGAPHVTEAGLV